METLKNTVDFVLCVMAVPAITFHFNPVESTAVATVFVATAFFASLKVGK